MAQSRSGSGSFGRVLIIPHSSSVGAPSSRRTTPYPVTAVPGSIPRTIIWRVSGLRHLLDVYVEVRIHLLHVVEVLELFHELHHALGEIALDLHGVLRDPRDLGFRNRELGRLQRGL